jgi:DNA polymerase phi
MPGLVASGTPCSSLYPVFCLIGFKDIHKSTSIDVFQESVDIDDMDEEEGRRLDKALSEAFSMLRVSKTNKKSKKQLNDDRILMHFRIRAIDLLEVYLKSDHVGTEASLLTYIDVMLVLFSLLEFCIRDVHQKPLENRVR